MDTTLRYFANIRRFYDQNNFQECALSMDALDNNAFLYAIAHGHYDRSFNTFLGLELVRRRDNRIFESKYASQCELFHLLSQWYIQFHEIEAEPVPYQPHIHYPYAIAPAHSLTPVEVRAYYRDYIDTTQERQHPLASAYCRFFMFHATLANALTYVHTLLDMIIRDPFLKEYHHQNSDDGPELFKNGTEHLYLNRLEHDLQTLMTNNQTWRNKSLTHYLQWFDLLLYNNEHPTMTAIYHQLTPKETLNAASWHHAFMITT